MSIDVVFISYKETVPPDSYWDQQMVKDLFSKEIWSWENQYDFKIHYNFDEVTDGAIVVVPARNQTDRVDRLNADISRLQWCIIILTGDEESVFPFEQITHPNWKLWVMSPRPERHKVGRLLGSGYAPDTRPILKQQGLPEKTLNWFYSGQVNNRRRVACTDQLESIKDRIPGEMQRTPGFIQGNFTREEYYQKLSSAKLAPAPSGGHTPDTFRLFEALESGCIPMADEFCDAYIPDIYWGWFFKDTPPFPLMREYHGMYEYMVEWLKDYQHKANICFAWWQKQKRKMAYNLREDIKELSGIDFNDDITVIIPTSPIEIHPSTEVIDQCIRDVRTKLPHTEIIIMIDGINPKQTKWRENYDEYTRRVLWKCNFEWHNVLPVVFDEHVHQVRGARYVLNELVRTPTILYVEHDAPLCPDLDFDYPWGQLVEAIKDGQINVIRFHHEASILESSKPMLIGGPELVHGVGMVKTTEWSMRPHLASTAFYKRMLNQYFSETATTMIEDGIYKHVVNECRDDAMSWYNWRLWIFMPEGLDGNWKRSYHLDARGSEPKYEEDFTE